MLFHPRLIKSTCTDDYHKTRGASKDLLSVKVILIIYATQMSQCWWHFQKENNEGKQKEEKKN